MSNKTGNIHVTNRDATQGIEAVLISSTFLGHLNITVRENFGN